MLQADNLIDQTSLAQGNEDSVAETDTLAVTGLVLTDFRNYAKIKLTTTERPVILCGPNGAGKTNILEAISYLSPGRGLRRARLADVRRQGASTGWSVAATLVTPDGDVKIGTGLQPRSTDIDAEADDETDNSGERRIVRINGAPAQGPGALAEYVRITWLTPRMDRLFLEGASSRRRFLDQLVQGFDAAHGRRVSGYERVLRERAHLLRSGRNDDTWLGALEARMAEDSVATAAARRDVVARLRGALGAGIGPFPRAELGLRGFAEEQLEHKAALEVENALRELLARSREDDREHGRARYGAHRSDLDVMHLEKNMAARMCSTGEQKALLIAMVLADARLQSLHQASPPLLLLDEIAAHLDDARRAALAHEIIALQAQAWMTGTDSALFEALKGYAQFMTVTDGEVKLDDG